VAAGRFLENLAPSAAHPAVGWSPCPRTGRVDRWTRTGETRTSGGATGRGERNRHHRPRYLRPDRVMGGRRLAAGRVDDEGGGSAARCATSRSATRQRSGLDGRRLLAVDSGLGHLVAIDPVAGTSAVWLAHELLGTLARDTRCRRQRHRGCTTDGSTSATASARCCCAARGQRRPRQVSWRWWLSTWAPTTSPSTERADLPATNVRHTVLRLDPDGHREDIAGLEQGSPGPRPPHSTPGTTALYVTSTGGMLNPPAGGVQPGRLVRLTLDS